MKLIWKGSTGCVMSTMDIVKDGEEWDGQADRNLEQALREFATLMQVGDSLVVVNDDGSAE